MTYHIGLQRLFGKHRKATGKTASSFYALIIPYEVSLAGGLFYFRLGTSTRLVVIE